MPSLGSAPPIGYPGAVDIRAVKFRVDGGWRVGGLYSPSRAGSFPAVLCLHGFPGVQKNEDIAAELCRRGMVCLMPYFRGCWGSDGRYTVSGMLEDVKAAHRLLSDYPHVDDARVGVFGVSLGGWAALRLASERPLAAAAVLAPAVDLQPGPEAIEYTCRNGKVLKVAEPRSLVGDYAAAMRKAPPPDFMPRISPCPLLLVQGLKDRMVPAASTRRLWRLAQEPKELVELADEEHEFQNNRAGLVKLVCGWLQRRLLIGGTELAFQAAGSRPSTLSSRLHTAKGW